jgi:nucleotide-binding universal stress UspA family protein
MRARTVIEKDPDRIWSARSRFGNIVVGVDGSAHARFALERAMQLPQLGGVLEIVHAIDAHRFASTVDREEEATQLVREARDHAERSIAVSGIREVTASVAWGPPFRVIADRARHTRAELAVIGRRFERGPIAAVIGATAERIVRHGSVPVLAVATPSIAPYRHPLVAVDVSASSRIELELAARICDPTVEELDVIHVVPFRPHWGSARYEQRLRETVESFASAVDAGVRWNVIVRFGEPRTAILEEADARGSDLIALGTKGRRGLAHVLLGSLAQGVLREASCDVLIAQLPEV